MQTHHHDRTNALSTMPYSAATSLPMTRPPHFTPMGLLLSHHNPAACNRPGDGMCLCVRARARCGRRWSKSSTPPLGSTDARFHDRGTSTHRHIDSDLCPRRRRLRGCRSAEVRGAPVVQHQNPAVRPARIPTQRPAAAATNARRLPPRRREPAAEKGGFIGCRQQQLRRGGAHCIGSRCADCRGSCELEHGRREAEIRAQGAGQHAS